MSEISEFEQPGIERLASDFSELALSIVDKRNINLTNESLDRLTVTFTVLTDAIEREKGVRAIREQTAEDFAWSVLEVQVENHIVEQIENDDLSEETGLDLEPRASELEHSDTTEAFSSFALGETIEVSEQADTILTVETSVPEPARASETSEGKPDLVQSKNTIGSRNVDWDEVEAVLTDVARDFKIGDEIKAGDFYKHPYFKDIIGDDKKGLSNARFRFKKAIDRLVEKGVLEHNGKIKSQSGYVVVKVPEITDNGTDFLDQ